MVLKYYPARVMTFGEYVSNASMAKEALSFELVHPSLVAARKTYSILNTEM